MANMKCDSCGKISFVIRSALRAPQGTDTSHLSYDPISMPGAAYNSKTERIEYPIEKRDFTCEHCGANLREQRLSKLRNYDPWALRVFARVIMVGFPLILLLVLSHPFVGIEDGRILWGIVIPTTALLWWWISRDDW